MYDDRPAKMRPANTRRAATNVRCYVLVGDKLNSSTATQRHIGLRLFNRDRVTFDAFDLDTVDRRSWRRDRVHFSGRRSSASWVILMGCELAVPRTIESGGLAMSEVQISDTNHYISALIAGLKPGEEIALVENGKRVAVLRKEPEVDLSLIHI